MCMVLFFHVLWGGKRGMSVCLLSVITTKINTIYPGPGPSIFMDVSIADQAEHWIHSVLAVLPDSKVVSSILPLWRSIGVKTRYIMMVITCADSGSS